MRSGRHELALVCSALSLRSASLLCSAVSLLGGLTGCDPFHTEFDAVESAVEYRAHDLTSAPKSNDQLVVMTYNVKFGGGRIDFFFDCHGDRVLMTEREVESNIGALARKIRQVDPDVLFLQEVDVNSKRSAFVDQLQRLLDETDLNYAVYASQWKADFVPSDGLGAVDSGNAIASKYRLHGGRRVALALRSDQDSLERYFYLRRNLLTARLDEDAIGEEVLLVATHTAAYSKDGTKRSHIERFEQELEDAAKSGIVIGGGDLNSVPPGSEQLLGFDDSACQGEFEADDYSEEQDWLDGLYSRFEPAIPLDDYQNDNAPYFSHTTSADGFWNRKLDYLFTNGHFSNGLVHQDASSGGMETMPLSDHAPLSALFTLDGDGVPSAEVTDTTGDAGDGNP